MEGSSSSAQIMKAECVQTKTRFLLQSGFLSTKLLLCLLWSRGRGARLELLNAACGVCDLFHSGKERMTLRADLNFDLLHRRANRKLRPTCAGHLRGGVICRVYVGLHRLTL